jgi:hypothetical protein
LNALGPNPSDQRIITPTTAATGNRGAAGDLLQPSVKAVNFLGFSACKLGDPSRITTELILQRDLRLKRDIGASRFPWVLGRGSALTRSRPSEMLADIAAIESARNT